MLNFKGWRFKKSLCNFARWQALMREKEFGHTNKFERMELRSKVKFMFFFEMVFGDRIKT